MNIDMQMAILLSHWDPMDYANKASSLATNTSSSCEPQHRRPPSGTDVSSGLKPATSSELAASNDRSRGG